MPTEFVNSTLAWYVAHTRPRREKKLAEYCQREGFLVTLPCYRAAHKYRGKTVAFRKPLFPGYVFLQLLQVQRQKVYQSDYVANLLDVRSEEHTSELQSRENLVCRLLLEKKKKKKKKNKTT